MNWPWNRDADADQSDETELIDQEEYTDEEETEDEDPLATLSEAGQQRVQELVAQASAERVDAIRRQVQAGGFDLTADDGLAVTDPARAAGWLGFTPGQPQEPAPANNQQAPVETDEMPDPYSEPAAFKNWIGAQASAQAKAQVEAAVAPLRQEAEALKAEARRSGIAAALPQVGAAIQQYLGHIPSGDLTDPRFEEEMTRALQGVDPAQWRDPRALTVLAGAAHAAFLVRRQQEDPKAAPPRGAGGRFVAPGETRRPERSPLSRAALTAGAPSRDAGRQPKGPEVTDLHRRLAEMLNISVAEAAGLGDPTGEASAKEREKRLAGVRNKR